MYVFLCLCPNTAQQNLLIALNTSILDIFLNEKNSQIQSEFSREMICQLFKLDFLML